MPEDLTTAPSLLKETYRVWRREGGQQLGASLGYYVLLSVIPLGIFLLKALGLVLGEETSRAQVNAYLHSALGPEAAGTARALLEEMSGQGPGVGATVLGAVILAFAASRMFNQIRRSLDVMWEFGTEHRGGLLAALEAQGLSLLVTVGLGVLLLLLYAVSTLTSLLVPLAGRWLPVGTVVLIRVADGALSLLGIFLLIAGLYRFLPRVTLPWHVVFAGAGVTSVLFFLGKLVVGVYFDLTDIASVFGAAGSVLILLIWVFYAAQIFFLGVAFTRVWETRRRLEA